MLFDELLEEHRTAGIPLHDGMHDRVRLVASAIEGGLGRLIYEEDVRRVDTPDLRQLKAAHASFHATALSIAISIEQGRLADAAVMLEPDALFESAVPMFAHAI